MRNQYSPSEFIKTVYSLVATKLTFPQARLVRRPIYIRGGKSISGGKNLTTGRFCRFDLEGIKKTLFIGENVEMGEMTHIVAHERVEIGNNVLFASKCFISDTDHGRYKGEEQSSPDEAPNRRKLYTKPVQIGNNVWIGENAVILAGAQIGDGCVIGANSIVKGEVPVGTMIAGAPAKVIKKWNIETEKWENVIQWSAKNEGTSN